MSTAPLRSPPSLRLAWLALIALAVLVRWAAWSSIGGEVWAENPTVDAWTYLQQTRVLFNGGDPFADGLYQPPGLPWLMHLEHWLVGADEVGTAVPRAFNLLFGLLTTLGLAAIGERIRPWLGFVAAAAYTLYPRTLLFELDLLTPAATSVLLVAALFVYRRSWWGAGLAGLAMGAAIVVHPTLLLAAAVFALALRDNVRAVGPFVLGVVLMLGPTMKRNADAGHFALVSHNAGLNFYLGNNADWLETAFLRPGISFRKLVVEADPANRDQYERNDWWIERAKGDISDAPARWVGTLATKALWSVNNREVPRNEDYRCRTRAGPLRWIGLLPIRYGLVFPLAVVGAFVCLSRRRWELPALWLALQAPMVLFLVADRYRMATLPVMLLLAALGGERLLGAAKALSWPVWALAAALGVVSFWPIHHVTAMHEGWCVHQDANEAMTLGDVAAARDLYEEASRLEPEQLGHWYWLGEARARTQDPEGAVAAWDHVLEDYPDHYPTLIAAARESGRLGRFSAAADYQGLACAIPGPRTNTCARYVELLFKARRVDEARAVLDQQPELREHEKVRGLLHD